MEELIEPVKEITKLEKIEFRYVKDIYKDNQEFFNYLKVFDIIAEMAKNKPKPIEIIISNYHGKYLTKDVQDYLSSKTPNIKITYSTKD